MRDNGLPALHLMSCVKQAAVTVRLLHSLYAKVIRHTRLCCMTLRCSTAADSHHSLVRQWQVCFCDTVGDRCRYGLLDLRSDALNRFHLPVRTEFSISAAKAVA
eukprot:GHUV01046818.1.p3 GENE.GHUV01046818.1~~GHUV01046818.1.p3  ORF type:complete len:104 (+),score=11.33 GHUV01046818.1:316-627(+)